MGLVGKILGEQKACSSRWPKDWLLWLCVCCCAQWPWGKSVGFPATQIHLSQSWISSLCKSLWNALIEGIYCFAKSIISNTSSLPSLPFPHNSTQKNHCFFKWKVQPRIAKIHIILHASKQTVLFLLHLKFHRNHNWINKIIFFPNIRWKDLFAVC